MGVLKYMLFQIPQRYRFSSKSQQPTASVAQVKGCFRYHKGTDFQANHNGGTVPFHCSVVVLDTTKVQIFKQITTRLNNVLCVRGLFQIPQRYRFSSKSQHIASAFHNTTCCFRYHKGTDFQANHNLYLIYKIRRIVVLDTTKVQIFKQITTKPHIR